MNDASVCMCKYLIEKVSKIEPESKINFRLCDISFIPKHTRTFAAKAKIKKIEIYFRGVFFTTFFY